MAEITERLHLERDALPTSDVDGGLRSIRRIVRRRRQRSVAVAVATAGGLLLAGIGATGVIGSDREQVLVTDTAPAATTAVDAPTVSETSVPTTTSTTTTIETSVGPTVGEAVSGRAVGSDLIRVTDDFRAVAGEDFSENWQVPWNDGFLVGGSVSATDSTAAYFSPDGRSWEAVQIEPGIFGPAHDGVLVADDRLVMLGALDVGGWSQPVVASTTDLANWSIEEIPVQAPPPDLPAVVQAFTWPLSITANADGWIAIIEHSLTLDTRTLAAQRTGRTADSLSEAWSDDGILVTIEPDGDDPDEVFLSWSEIAEEIGDDLTVAVREGTRTEVWTGTLDDDAPVRLDDPDGTPLPRPFEPLVATDTGFVTLETTTEFPDDAPPVVSTRLWKYVDSSGWAELTVPAPGRVEYVFPLDGDLGVVIEADDLAISIHRVDIDREVWTRIEVPRLPATASYVETFRTAALDLDASPDDDVENQPSTTTFEQNGFRLTWIYENYISSYEVTSLATDDVVVSESIDLREVDGSFELAFEHLTGGLSLDTTITDPETGDVLMDITSEELQAANPREPYFGPDPEPWIVATDDGTSWFVHEVPPRPTDDGMYYQESMTVSGGRLLYWSDSREWFLVDLT